MLAVMHSTGPASLAGGGATPAGRWAKRAASSGTNPSTHSYLPGLITMVLTLLLSKYQWRMYFSSPVWPCSRGL